MYCLSKKVLEAGDGVQFKSDFDLAESLLLSLDVDLALSSLHYNFIIRSEESKRESIVSVSVGSPVLLLVITFSLHQDVSDCPNGIFILLLNFPGDILFFL